MPTLKSMVTGAVVLALSLVLAGCANGPNIDTHDPLVKATVQYATLKAIEESHDFTAEDVASKAADYQDRVASGDSVLLSRLESEFYAEIGFKDMAPSDQLLIAALVSQIEYNLGDVGQGTSPLGEDRRVQLLTLLGWIQEAAELVSDER